MNDKYCLLTFRNKKINYFDYVTSAVSEFASANIYFDRVEFCNYGDGEEITRSIKECTSNYAGLVFVCPGSMSGTVKTFTEKLLGAAFDEFGVLYSPELKVFVLDCDGGGKLTVSDIISIISKDRNVSYGRAYVKTVNAPVQLLNSVISKAHGACPACNFNISEKFANTTIEIVYPDSIPKSEFDSVYRTLVGGLNDYIYALEDISLAERLYDLLKLRRMKISVSESFTGGGIAKRLVDVSGISEVYFEGINTYANESKMKRLGVEELTLKQYGAVSEKTAYEMAEGLLKTGDCDLAISTTGIAGPKSDSTMKPVGLCYIGAGTRDGISVFEYKLQGSRERITETAINLALFHAFKLIK